MLDSLELPSDIKIYDVDGQRIFPVYTATSIDTKNRICLYKIANLECGAAYTHVVEFSTYIALLSEDAIRAEMQSAIERFVRDLNAGIARPLNLDGGEFGGPDTTIP